MSDEPSEEGTRGLYLDASALVKLIVKEPQSAALADAVAGRELLTSELSVAEVPRAVRRIRGDATRRLFERLNDLVPRLDFVPLTRGLLLDSAELPDPGLRAMDAIHVVTALRVKDALDALITYDRRQRASAEASGLPVRSPA